MARKIFIFVVSALTASAVFAEGIVSFQQYERINTPANPHSPDNWFDFQYVKEKDHKGNYSSQIDVSVRMLNGEDSNTLISLGEAYVELDRGRTQTSAGRKILDWCPTEDFWGLGHINPLRGFSLLEEKQEGLPGIFLEHKGNVNIGVYASYFHIPQLNPGYKIKDGEVRGTNEWTRLPPKRISYHEGQVPVHYTLIMPEYSEIVLQESLGVSLGKDWKGGDVKVFGLYKPEPLARINATGHYEQKTVNRAAVRARPFVNHHTIVGTAATQDVGMFKMNLGAFVVRPRPEEDPKFEFEKIRSEPTYLEERYAMFEISNRVKSFFNYKLSAIRGSEKVIKKPEGDGPNFFGASVKWKNAIGANVSYSLNDYLSVMADWKGDMSTGDRLFTQEISYRVFGNGKISGGMEVLFSPQQDSYWAAFRSNDTFYTNFSYVF